MSRCLQPSEFDRLLADTTMPGDRSPLQSHLSSCDKCRGAYESLRTQREIAQGGDPVEGYEILGEVHRGGQGSIYKAVQKSTERIVALKVLREGTEAPGRHRHRFEREIHLAAGLKHPNIVTIYESGLTRGQYFFAMEYVHGQRLDDYLSEKHLPIEETLRLFVVVCDAVDYAHQHGVMHRDLKPCNILVDVQGQPRILDFGLAKSAATQLVDGRQPATITSEFMGTLSYASPEQLEGDPTFVDMRTDVYSLGVVLYHLLTGAYPHQATWNLKELLRSITETPPKKPSALCPQISPELDNIILKALAKDQQRRYQTAGELGRDIERFLQGRAIEARRESPWYVARIRMRAQARKHPLMTLLGVMLVATLVVEGIIRSPLLMRTPANRLFERLATTPLFGAPTAALDHVAIVGLTDLTAVGPLAEKQGLSGVDPRNIKSLRRLHGCLMHKLAAAGVSAVVWDIAFRGQTEFDHDFLEGVRALKQAGTRVIVGLPDWRGLSDGASSISQIIAPEVLWGCTTTSFGDREQWQLELAMRHGVSDPLPSLTLAAVAAARQPQAEFSILLDPSSETLKLAYWNADSELPRVKKWLDDPDRVRVSAVWVQPQDRPKFGLSQGDQLASFKLTMPSDAILTASTLEYEEVFGEDQAELRRRLADRVVVVGDLRSGIDRHAHPDGRILSGCQGHAVAINALLKHLGAGLRGPLLPGYPWTALGALAGVVVALLAPRRISWRCAAYALLAVLFTMLSIWFFHDFGYLCNPLLPILGLILSSELAAAVNRATSARGWLAQLSARRA